MFYFYDDDEDESEWEDYTRACARSHRECLTLLECFSVGVPDEAWLGDRAVAVVIDFRTEPGGPKIVAMRGLTRVGEITTFDRQSVIDLLDLVDRGEWLVPLREAAHVTPVDVMKRSFFADSLVDMGYFDEACEEYAWLWEHGGEVDREFFAVRGSFLIGMVELLAKRHPPTRARFTAYRDAIDPADASVDQLWDWFTLDRAIGDNVLSLAWFDSFDPSRASPKLVRIVEIQFVGVLHAVGRDADAGRLISDPLGRVEQSHASLQRHKQPNVWLAETRTLVQLLRVAGRDEDERAALGAILERDPSWVA